MDRPTVFPGAIPRSVDVLRLGQSAMVGLAKLSEAVLGTGAVVDGFTLVPTSPATFSAVLSGGSVYQQENLEATSWSTLPADSHTIVKQGLNLDPTTLTFAPPTTTGYAQCFLVEAQYLDTDTGATVLPYYNSANPQVPYTGPGNAGTADNTIRKGGVAVQVKAGVAALAGTQVVPSPDAGWVGLYYVTLAAGATTVTTGNITLYPGAPFLAAKLGSLPSYIQNDAGIYCVDQGTTANQIIVSPVPAFAAYQPGQRLKIKLIRAITGATTVNVSGLGTRPLVRQSGAACVGNEAAVGDHIEVSVRDNDIQLIRLSTNDIVSSTTFVTNLTQNYPSLSPPKNGRFFRTAGTYVLTIGGTGPNDPPATVTDIFGQIVGGGGGGGAASSGSSPGYSGGGGGSGGVAADWVRGLVPGNKVTVVIGAGALGGSVGNGNAGATGGASTLTASPTNGNAVSLVAPGGGGGAGGTVTCSGGPPGVGSGSAINFNLPGAAGGDGNPGNLLVQGGAGGASCFGGGGRTSTVGPTGGATTSTVANGVAPGSGGGGIWQNSDGLQHGGNGADGGAFIQW